jgi:ATP-dependent Clp protease protease subunit
MYNALLRHQGAVTVAIDALAASAASIVAMAWSTIEIAQAAFVMVHNSWTFALGDAASLRETADTLGKVDQMQVDIFASRTKQTAEQIKQWLDAETWMTAQEAVDRGFATKIGQTLGGAKACVKPNAFRNVPAALSTTNLPPSLMAARAARRKLALARAR